jgi:hypothetical protein
MAFLYTNELIDNALTYPNYRKGIKETLDVAPTTAAAEKMRPHIVNNLVLMDEYDQSYQLSRYLDETVATAPSTIWLVITEGWCGDAAFNIPMFNIIEKRWPEKIKLRLVLRDNNLELMDANLTEGGRSIPKLIVLDNGLEPLGYWGPRPAGLQEVMKQWKKEGLELMELILKVHEWYNTDNTQMLQQELITLIEGYSKGIHSDLAK